MMKFDDLGQTWRETNATSSSAEFSQRQAKWIRRSFRLVGLLMSLPALAVVYLYCLMIFDPKVEQHALPIVTRIGATVILLWALQLGCRLYSVGSLGGVYCQLRKGKIDASLKAYLHEEIAGYERSIQSRLLKEAREFAGIYFGLLLVHLGIFGLEWARVMEGLAVWTVFYAFLIGFGCVSQWLSGRLVRDQLQSLRDEIEEIESTR